MKENVETPKFFCGFEENLFKNSEISFTAIGLLCELVALNIEDIDEFAKNRGYSQVELNRILSELSQHGYIREDPSVKKNLWIITDKIGSVLRETRP